jgi:hypothetical protein
LLGIPFLAAAIPQVSSQGRSLMIYHSDDTLGH